jgi:hypothetical protein
MKPLDEKAQMSSNFLKAQAQQKFLESHVPGIWRRHVAIQVPLQFGNLTFLDAIHDAFKIHGETNIGGALWFGVRERRDDVILQKRTEAPGPVH